MKACFLRLSVVLLTGFLVVASPVQALQTDAVEPVAGFEPSRVTVSLNGFVRTFYKVDNVIWGRMNDNFYGLSTQINLMISPSPYWAFYGRINANALDRRAQTIERQYAGYPVELDSSPEFDVWLGEAYVKFNLSGNEFRLGRIGTEYDAWGLAGLGWAPATAFTRVAPFDNGYAHDGVHWNYDFGNGLSLHALAGRAVTTEFARKHGWWNNLKWYEGRYFVAQAEGRKLWPNGGASLALRYERDATNQWETDQDYNVIRAISLNPAFRQSFGKFSVQAEARISWARQEERRGELIFEEKETAFGAFANLSYDLGKGALNLSGWYFSGHKIDDQDSTLVSSGFDFYPLLIAYNSGTGPRALNDFITGTSVIELASIPYIRSHMPDYLMPSPDIQFANNSQNNHWAIAVSGDYQILDNLTLHAALAYLRLVHSNYRVAERAILESYGWDVQSYIEQAKSLGLELNVGISYDILPCLNLSTMGGYFWAGDALRPLLLEFQYNTAEGTLTEGDEFNLVWEKPRNHFAWYTSLTWYF